MLRGEFSPEAQKAYRTKKQQRWLKRLELLSLWAEVLGFMAMACSSGFIPQVIRDNTVLSPGMVPMVIALILCVAAVMWHTEAWEKQRETIPNGYTVIEKANGEIHCSLQPPHDLGNGLIGYRGAHDVPQPISPYFIKALLEEGAEGHICSIDSNGKVVVGQFPKVIVNDPMGDFTFEDGFNGTYRWMWDVQSCQRVKIEDLLYGYFKFWSFQSMAFLPRGVGHEYDTPWGQRESRRETARVLLAMMNYVHSSTGRIPVKPLQLLISVALEKINLPAVEIEALATETNLNWTTIATEVGVKLPASMTAPMAPAEATA